MTTETLRFLLTLVDAQQLSIGAPDFEQTAAAVIKVRRELVEAIEHEQA